jgi:hypothetical protein
LSADRPGPAAEIDHLISWAYGGRLDRPVMEAPRGRRSILHVEEIDHLRNRFVVLCARPEERRHYN